MKKSNVYLMNIFYNKYKKFHLIFHKYRQDRIEKILSINDLLFFNRKLNFFKNLIIV
ncbi:hypothetical protein [Blattabacterium cuenoti]|uniref:hypothetical protein n=1 Tax=Blattabacterium cuenoti TaxID=1653831 RepID=UPI00163CDDDF|nr:hypothetical protein [Blattabacterium cuenoti]